MASLMPNGKQRYTDNNGNNLSGGKLYAFAAGTSTPLDTYSDQAGATPNAHPVVLNARGEATVFWGSSPYKVVLKDASDVEIWSQDNMQVQSDAADLASVATGKGDALIGVKLVATGSVARTQHDKNAEIISVKDFGAVGDGSTNDTAAVQAAVNAILADSTKGSAIYFPQGDYRVDQITVDLSTVVPSGAGKLTIYGDGIASQVTIRSAPNQNIFQVTGNAGQSFSFHMKSLRFGVASQGNNVAAAVIDTSSSTMLDFQIFDCYFNGVPRGVSGSFVSGIINNCMFDFMTDYAIYSPSKEFRKLEITNCHFYKVKDSAIYIDGSAASDANRDNTQAGGHLTITGCGFDRTFDNTVNQDQIVLKGLDNFVISGCWFNGKTPSSTDSPRDFIQLTDCRNFVLSGLTAYYYSRGLYIDASERFKVDSVHIRQGNLLASSGQGAVTYSTCSDFNADVHTFESQGTGVLVTSCNDFTITGRTTDAQFSGVVVSDSQRGEATVEVVDANMADSGTASNTYGIAITGSTASAGILLNGCSSYVTNVSAGQKENIVLSAVSDTCRVSNCNATPVRTSGSAITNNGTNNRIRATRGYETKSSGQATITNPATTAVVNHGLALTPSIADIKLTFNDASAGVTRVWPSTITSTQFTINANATPTTSSIIGWHVDTEK
jgi:hypothetical protein